MDGKNPSYCEPKPYLHRDPTDPTKVKPCHKKCGKTCKDAGESGCMECDPGRHVYEKEDGIH